MAQAIDRQEKRRNFDAVKPLQLHRKASYFSVLSKAVPTGSNMLLEEQRYIHEDLERLEQGIADRMSDEPKHVSSPAQPSLSAGERNAYAISRSATA